MTTRSFVGGSEQDVPTRLLTTFEAAVRLGLSSGTLNNWRCEGRGPRFTRLGKAVRYTEEDLARFIAQGRAAQ